MPVIDLGSVVGPQGPQGATGATGAQGRQGAAGPNQITSATTTTLTGVLSGANGAVGVRSVDTAPATLSTNLITSGGVADAMSSLRGAISNPNLLDNWFFVGGGSTNKFPINQRGNSTYYANSAYSIDRWKITNANTTVTVAADGLVVTGVNGSNTGVPVVRQYITEQIDNLRGKTVTLSFLTKDAGDNYTLYKVTTTIPSSDPSAASYYASLADIGSIIYQSGTWAVRLIAPSGGSNKFVAVKLEIGNASTLCSEDSSGNLVLNEIPNYAEQLLRCHRYYLRLSAVVRYPLTRYAPGSRQLDFMIPIPVEFANTPAIEDTSLFSVAAGASAASGTYTYLLTGNSYNAIAVRATGASGVTVPTIDQGISLLITSGAAITAET